MRNKTHLFRNCISYELFILMTIVNFISLRDILFTQGIH